MKLPILEHEPNSNAIRLKETRQAIALTQKSIGEYSIDEIAAEITKRCNCHDALLAALEKYGEHLGACFKNLTMGKCNCGLEQAIAKAKELK